MFEIDPHPHRHRRPTHSSPRTRQRLVTPFDALSLVTLVAAWPIVGQTIVITLDVDRCGCGLVIADGPDDPDLMVTMVDGIADVARFDPDAGAIVVASLRPTGAVDVDDPLRWQDADEICADAGIDLIEWFVLGPTTMMCPRELVGEPARWGG